MTWAAHMLRLPPAQVAPSGTDLSVLGNYGLLGALFVALLGFALKMILREARRADANDAEVKRLNGFIAEKVVPALVEARQAMQAQNEILRESSRATRR